MLKTLLTSLKSNIYAVGAVVLATLGVWLRMLFLKQSRDKAREGEKRAKAELAQTKANKVTDQKVKEIVEDKVKEAKEQDKSGKIPDIVSNPNDF